MAHKQTYQNKTAIITGGASGLGLALADQLAKLGATPVLIDTAERDIPYHLEIADVSDAGALSSAIGRIVKTHGPVEIAIANAAIDLTGEAHTFTPAEWRKIIEVNLIGATNLVSAVYPDMAKRQSGQLILIASGAGLIGFPLGAPYTASKAGMIGMAKALRAEATRFGVSVCIACPPALDTPLFATGKAKPGIDRQRFLTALDKTPMSAQTAADHILRKAAADKSPIIFPAKIALGDKLTTLFPSLGEKVRAGLLKTFDRHGRL